MIIREKYLSKIRPFYEQDLIKVITGIRRCGKSILLTQIIKELKDKGIDGSHIIYINFEYEDFSFIKSDTDFHEYIKSKIVDSEKYYLFFDEVQMIDKWERVVNSFKASMNTSIFITGSNGDMLSSELATLLSGRYVSFKVYPFTFKEVCEFKGNEGDKTKLFNEYVLWGGLPQRFVFNDAFQIKTYLSDIYDSIILKDIVKRFNIKNIDLFNRIIEYIAATPSEMFSSEALIKYFKSNGKGDASKETIYNYLDFMSRAYLINKVGRYDLKENSMLSGKYKYYLTDLGLGQIMSGGKKEKIGSYLENIVYNELVSRGYNVRVGIFGNKEIDFFAVRFEEKLYIQVCYILADDDVVKREFGVYDKIKDNYPKYVLSMDNYDFSQNGIIHKNIIDWLCEE